MSSGLDGFGAAGSGGSSSGTGSLSPTTITAGNNSVYTIGTSANIGSFTMFCSIAGNSDVQMRKITVNNNAGTLESDGGEEFEPNLFPLVTIVFSVASGSIKATVTNGEGYDIKFGYFLLKY